MGYFTCKDCSDRRSACHGTCEKYKKEREKWEKAKEYLEAEAEFHRYKSRICEKTRHKR